MNVLDAESESCEKPRAACCAAINALVTLMAVSRLKAANGRANGSLAGVRVEVLTDLFRRRATASLGIRTYHCTQLHLGCPALF
jgi:hypothetical protein